MSFLSMFSFSRAVRGALLDFVLFKLFLESVPDISPQCASTQDREIGGLNEQLEEDSKTMEHLQIQLQQERTKRMQVSCFIFCFTRISL